MLAFYLLNTSTNCSINEVLEGEVPIFYIHPYKFLPSDQARSAIS